MATPEREPRNLYQQIVPHSQIIADTADYLQLDSLPPVDEVTTNPTIIWQVGR
jgi:transaldolase